MTKLISTVLVFLFFVQLFGQTKTLQWHYRMGGVGTDYGVGVALDSDENVFDVMVFNGLASITFETTFTSRGAEDILIRKSTSLGFRQWIKQLGSTGSDIAASIAVDMDDNVYISGTYTDSLFLDGQFLLEGNAGQISSFILKLSNAGTMLWVKRFISSSVVELKHLTVNSPDDLVVSGTFEGVAELNNTITVTSEGGRDILLLKINGLSGDIIFHKQMGSPDQENVSQHVRDNQNNIYLIGDFRSLIDLDPGSGTFLANSNGLTDIFIVKLNTFGDFTWARTFGGIGVDFGHSVAVDASRNVVITGRFSEIISFGAFEHVLQSNGGTDIFLTQLGENGQTKWARKMGSSQNDQGSNVKIGPKNIIYLNGFFRQTTDFNPNTKLSNSSTSNGGSDGFIALYNYDGTYNDHYTLGGLANDYVSDLVVRTNGEVISTGAFGAIVDFDPSSGVVNIFSSGGLEGFLWNVFVCVNPYLKSIRVEKDMLCFGERVLIEIEEGYLNDATQWSWQRDSCNNITFASGDFLNVNVPRNTTFFVKGFGGCISNDTCRSIPITVFRDTLNYQSITLCEGDSVTIGNSVYKTSGVFIDSLVSVAGCDSVVVLEIIVSPQYFSSGTTSICNGDTLRVGDNIYTLSGTYMDIFSTVEGCDSTIVTNLEVLPSRITQANAQVCKGDSVQVGNEYYQDSGTFIQTSINEYGCIDQLIVQIEQIKTEFNQFVILCQGDSLVVGNSTYKTSGAFQDKLISTLGCDSIVSSFVSLRQPSSFVQDIGLCFGDSLIVGNTIYKRTGNFIDTLMNAAGCDSLVESNIRVFNFVPTTEFDITICEGDSIIVGSNFYNEPGFYVDVLSNINGCDSIIETQLTVLPNIVQIVDTICFGESYMVDTFLIQEGGVYSFLYTNSLGCDSTIILDLTVLDLADQRQDFLICPGDTIDLGYRLIISEGLYRDTLQTINGCDSLVVTKVEWNNKVVDISVKICSGGFVEINDKIYDAPGQFTDTIVLPNNCDSLLNITIEEWSLNSIDTVFRICRGETVKVGDNVYSNSGRYVEFLQDQNGCDSIVNFRIEIISFIPSFTHSMDTLKTTHVEGTIYQWYRCMNEGLIPILGATGQQFIVLSSGQYALGVTFQGCTYITDCISIVKSSIGEIHPQDIKIYPNPGSNWVFIEGVQDFESVSVFTANGTLMNQTQVKSNIETIDTKNWTSGVYFIKLLSKNNDVKTFKYVKIE